MPGLPEGGLPRCSAVYLTVACHKNRPAGQPRNRVDDGVAGPGWSV